jgi:mRNA interferase RelE/StbE
MKYTIELKPKAVKDLKSIQLKDRKKILDRMDALEDDLSGNVKKLTNFTPEYRMRSGNWRVLFEVEESRIIIYRIRRRKEAYR